MRINSNEAKQVVDDVTDSMSWVVTQADLNHAVKSLERAPADTLRALEDNGSLAHLAKKLAAAPELRCAFLKSLGLPERDGLVVNDGALPPSLRAIVHDENVSRAKAHMAHEHSRLEAYCAAVEAAPDVLALRKLGPWQSTPSLSEPGLTDRNRGQWSHALTPAGFGLERAGRAVSNRISDFRKEPRAASYGLEASISARAGSTVFVSNTLTAAATTAGVSVRAQSKLGVQTAVGSILNTGFTVKGKGIEAEQDGAKTRITARMAEVGAYTQLEAAKGDIGAGVSIPDAFGSGATIRLGATATGMPREYYADMFSRQGGVFGDMPELTSGVAFESLSPERRAWYERQGVTAKDFGL